MTRITGLIAAVLLCAACNTDSHTQPLQLKGYDWSRKTVSYLQTELDEISGIAFDGRRQQLLAINDELGTLYALQTKDFNVVQRQKFGRKGDYECINLHGDQVSVLKSNGDISIMNWDGNLVSEVRHYSWAGPVTEFEATLWDKSRRQLLLISKKSGLDKSEQATHIYAFDPATGSYAAGAVASISWQEIRSKGINIKGFHPSAAAIEPGTGNIYLVSSIEKLMVICDAGWKVLSTYTLDATLFRQPEGICFDDNGNLYISNEAAGKRASIIFIPRAS